MKFYRFSPINNEERLLEAIKYVARETTRLCNTTIGVSLPISYLTIFSHYPAEYSRLIKMIRKLGKFHDENNGPRIRLNKPVKILNNTIEYIRIRKPDPYRMQVGCSDFDVRDYKAFKNKYKSHNLRVIVRPEYEMMEFFNPDFDVLAYIVSN